MLLAGAFFGTTLGVFSIQTVVGLYGLFVFLLSIVTVFLFIRQQQPRRLLAVPIYVIIVPMILFGLSWLIDGSGQTSITLVILTWIAVLGEIALAGSQLTPDLRGW